jgi:uncharacterized protein DUF2690
MKAMRHVVRALSVGAAAAAVLSVAGFSTAAAADTTTAALCSGVACDGLDPAVTGCDASATTVDSAPTSFGPIDLRFSSACQTNWVRIRNYPGGGTSLVMSVTDIDRGVQVNFPVPTPISAGTHFGDMVFSPAQNCTLAAVFRNGVQIGRTLASSTC